MTMTMTLMAVTAAMHWQPCRTIAQRSVRHSDTGSHNPDQQSGAVQCFFPIGR